MRELVFSLIAASLMLFGCDSAHSPERRASTYNEVLAAELFRQHDYNDAIASYSLALNGDLTEKQRVECLFGRGRAYDRKGQETDALADYSAALLLDPKSVFAHSGQARVLLKRGQIGEAVLVLKASLGLAPQSAKIHVELGNAYNIGHLYGQALSEFDAAIAIQRYNPRAYEGRGHSHLDLGQTQLAFEDFGTAAKLAPDDETPVVDLAVLNMSFDRCDRAKLDADNAIALDANSAAAMRVRGAAEFCMNQYEAAKQDFTATLALDPYDRYAALWLYLDRVHLHERDAAGLSAYITQHPFETWPQPVFDYFLGRKSEAQLMAAADQGDPAIRDDRRCEASYYLGEDAYFHSAFDRARSLFKTALNSCPLGFIERNLAAAELRKGLNRDKAN